MRLTPTTRAGVVLALLIWPASLAAQQRPLVTEDPESVGSGLVLLEAGFDYQRDQHFPVSGLTGHLRSLPRFGVSIGVSSIAEVQIDNVSYDTLRITGRRTAPLSGLLRVSGDDTSSWSDTVIGAKTRLVSEGGVRPGVALRFATKLPNAGNEEGIGLDTMDFYNSLLIGKTVRSLRVVGNVGFGILSDPTRGDRQNDVLTYGLSFARAFAEGAEIVGEVNGRTNTRRGTAPPGTDDSGYVRFGARFTRGLVRLDAALVAGLGPHDAGFGVTTGLTWVFRALDLP